MNLQQAKNQIKEDLNTLWWEENFPSDNIFEGIINEFFETLKGNDKEKILLELNKFKGYFLPSRSLSEKQFYEKIGFMKALITVLM